MNRLKSSIGMRLVFQINLIPILTDFLISDKCGNSTNQLVVLILVGFVAIPACGLTKLFLNPIRRLSPIARPSEAIKIAPPSAELVLSDSRFRQAYS
jgi:hypothetical protein